MNGAKLRERLSKGEAITMFNPHHVSPGLSARLVELGADSIFVDCEHGAWGFEDVRNAAQSVETSRRRVLTAREARANAELQLEGEQRLYSVGRSTTFLLFQRENALANARDAELRAETDYNKALAALQHATSTTLHANNVIVESRVAP